MSQDYIYLIRAKDQDLYKIGRTARHPEVRLKELNGQQSPYLLLLKYYTAVSDAPTAEKYFHEKFERYRHHNEWFKMSPSVAASVERDFKNYQPGSVHGAGARPKPKKRGKGGGRSRSRRSKNPWPSILLMSGVLLVITQWSKLPSIASCISTFDFGKCAKIR
jgi:hypothetical protein